MFFIFSKVQGEKGLGTPDLDIRHGLDRDFKFKDLLANSSFFRVLGRAKKDKKTCTPPYSQLFVITVYFRYIFFFLLLLKRMYIHAYVLLYSIFSTYNDIKRLKANANALQISSRVPYAHISCHPHADDKQ